MAEPFLGEIRMFAGNFAPEGWAFCNGQLFPIAEYTALFSLLGTQYGGNGTTDFALPNMQGNVPVHMGNGFAEGQTGGATSHALTLSELPAHNHSLAAVAAAGTSSSPSGSLQAIAPTGLGNVYGPPIALAAMESNAIGPVGGSQPHSNLQPFLAVSFIIALQGIYPSRS